MICFVERSVVTPGLAVQVQSLGVFRRLTVGRPGSSGPAYCVSSETDVVCWSIADVIGPDKILISDNDQNILIWREAGLSAIDVQGKSSHEIQEEVDWMLDRFNSRMQICFPQPPKALHPNGRAGWRKKAAAVKEYRQSCSEIATGYALEQFGERPRIERAEIQTVWYHASGGKAHDPDNLIAWMKAGFDALTTAGVLDDDKQLIHLPPVQDRDRVNPRVEINITPLV